MSNSPMCSGWKLRELHHVGLTVADLERSIAFYGGTLGMILLRRRPHVDHDYVALADWLSGCRAQRGVVQSHAGQLPITGSRAIHESCRSARRDRNQPFWQ